MIKRPNYKEYNEGYNQGATDVLITILNEYDEDWHSLIIPKDALYGIANTMDLDLDTAIREYRYKLAADLIGRSVEWLKEIDKEGPQCESSLPVYECILQDCPHLTHCHFATKWWEESRNEKSVKK